MIAAVLIAIGLGVSERLAPTMTFVPGSDASHAEDLAESKFGPSTLVPILLEGPKANLDRQGPALVRKLRSRSDTRVLSAWDAGAAGAELRPSPTQAMMVASVARSDEQMIEKYQEQIDKTVDSTISAPVKSHTTGTPTLGRASKDEALDTLETGYLIALPIIFLALLLILRAPLAALIVTVFGGVTAYAGLGAMSLVAEAFDTDAIAAALATLMGLAMGSGLSLVVLSRFHREEEPGAMNGSHREAAVAATATVASTGRAVLIGGTGLVIALAVGTMVGPTDNLNSIGTGVFICTLLGMGGAVVVMPAVLSLLGHKVFVGSFGAPKFVSSPWNRLVGAERVVLRRAVIVGAFATAALLALAIPITQLETGPPSPEFLPTDSKARQDFEAVQKAMGPGWPTPFNVVVASNTRPVTDTKLLRQIELFQERIARDDRVDSVAGPGAFRAETADLGTLKKQLNDSKKLLTGGKKDLGKLESGLGQAGAGALTLQSGLSQAAAGSGAAQGGAGQLEAGLAKARSGSAQIAAGLNQAQAGAEELKNGSGQALAGAEQLSGGLGQAAKPVKEGLPVVQQLARDVASGSEAVKSANSSAQSLSGQIDAALAALNAMDEGKNDPSYDDTVSALNAAKNSAGNVTSSLSGTTQKMEGAAGVSAAFAQQVAELSKGLDQLYAGSNDLAAGITRLRDGNTALAGGIEKLAGGGGDLTGGLTQLRDGAGELQAGLGVLSGGLGEGVGPVGQLAAGLGVMESGVAKFSKNLPSPKDLARLQAQSPGLFDSGYFVLAAIEGAQPNDRNQATFAVNLERGGSAGQIIVVPKQPASEESTQQLGEDLKTMSANFAHATGTETAVGGPAGELGDFESDISAEIWPVVAAAAVAILLWLMIALRSVLIPVVMTAFNLLVVGATFGVVALLTTGDDPILGGPGYIDSLQVIETFTAAFGIVLIFEMLTVWRTRELFVKRGQSHEALAEALRETAAPATGAAAVMIAAVIPFTFSGLFNLRLTISLAIVLALEALIVRPVLLPAAIELFGRRGWWPTKPASASKDAPTPMPTEPRPAVVAMTGGNSK